MDLIYTDENKVDIGVIPYFDMDLAFGSDENNFELTINLEDHCCQMGYYIYIDGTEYGGIIDAISVDSKAKAVTYSGRTWHGILENKIIYPEGDYKVVSGDANTILQALVEELDLTDIFEVEQTESGRTIFEYQFERYVDAYKGILRMLNSSQSKLKMAWNHATNKIKLWAELSIDHTDLDDWDSTQLEFNITQTARYINHLICLGQGELSNRAIIHLFADENGVIQPYKLVDEPLQDSDYILDTSQQKLFGEDELVDVYDFSSAGIAEKFEELDVEPADWESENYENYYYKNGAEYENLEIETQEFYDQLMTQPNDWATHYKDYYFAVGAKYDNVEPVYGYTLLTAKPNKWEENYGNYFVKVGNEYKPVQAQTVAGQVAELIKKPKDWAKKYNTYYEYNGVEYVTVSGISKDKYILTNERPNDWENTYVNYYYKTTIWEKKKVKKKTTYVKKDDSWCPADTYYDQESHEQKEFRSAPKWNRKKYYVKSSYNIAPEFQHTSLVKYYKIADAEVQAPPYAANTYYKQDQSQKSAPPFVAGNFFALSERNIYKPFSPGKYYKMVYDRIEELAEEGVKELQDIIEKSQSVNIDFDASENYDILDLVGATEQMTGIAVKQQILKKIVKMTEKKQEINYEIGAMI